MFLGYEFTAVYTVFLLTLTASAWFSRKAILKAFKGKVDRATCIIAVLVFFFFIMFSLGYAHSTEQLYFDENIYQGIALNILHNGNALWCQFGNAYLTQCPESQIYHDPVEWSYYIAIAFVMFGPSVQVSSDMQLFIGAVAILVTFLLGSLLLGKRGGVAAAVIIALIPEMFTWSATQAVPDLGFMTFSALAFLCYVIYDRTRQTGTLLMFLSALSIAIYMRIEGALLIPIFICLYLFGESRKELFKRLHAIAKAKIDANAIALLVFLICLAPEVYYITYQFSSLDYGTGYLCGFNSNKTFSVSNFMCNAPINLNYFAGGYDAPGYFPAYFSPITTALALIGIAALLIQRHKGTRKTVLLLGLWILAYLLFYDFFYAGSVTYGVDVRFMLQLYPAIALFGAAAIDGMCVFASYAWKRISKSRRRSMPALWSVVVLAALLGIFAVYPFVSAFNDVTVLPQNMPQEPQPLAATSFIYSNYNSVPASCLVFSFTPDIWYELGRSSAQIGYLGDSGDANFTSFEKNYSCFVLDYGYWCVVPPYDTGTCYTDTHQYNLTTLASSQAPGGQNLALYRINSYYPPNASNITNH